MSIIEKIKIVCGNVLTIKADLLWLKYADGFRGADASVAAVLGLDFDNPPPAPYLNGRGVSSGEVAFAQVGPLFDFRYAEITSFATEMVSRIAKDRPNAKRIATTIHGPGYGLDEREAFLSLLKGYLAAETPTFERLIIVEEDSQRTKRLLEIFEEFRTASRLLSTTGQLVLNGFEWLIPYLEIAETVGDATTPSVLKTPEKPDAPGQEKPKLFVAMPFSESHRDEYDIAFVESAHANGFICERLDMESYVGDVTGEIAKRIGASCGIIALLNDANPNVFFEVGYAMALDKPIIFVARDGQEIPFDVRNQRRITYSRIAELRDVLRSLIGDLKDAGTLV